jgi:hypothetical protein
MGVQNYSTVSKADKLKAAKTFSMASKTDGGDIEVEEDDSKQGLTPTFPVEVKLPSGLRTRAFKSENSVSFLQVATVIYNNELNDKPELGFGKVIVILGQEKMDYDYRVHSVAFNPTMDLENTDLTAEISTTDNDMIKRLIKDNVISFYVTGKLTQNEEKELETVVINKIIAHVDQTAYAKKFAAENKFFDSLPKDVIKEEIFNDPELGGVKMAGVAEMWKEFSKDFPSISKSPVDNTQSSMFAKWRKAIKGKIG